MSAPDLMTALDDLMKAWIAAAADQRKLVARVRFTDTHQQMYWVDSVSVEGPTIILECDMRDKHDKDKEH